MNQYPYTDAPLTYHLEWRPISCNLQAHIPHWRRGRQIAPRHASTKDTSHEPAPHDIQQHPTTSNSTPTTSNSTPRHAIIQRERSKKRRTVLPGTYGVSKCKTNICVHKQPQVLAHQTAHMCHTDSTIDSFLHSWPFDVSKEYEMIIPIHCFQ